eukprot:scaffold126683_cov15-Tisochrysis_lutea.AAC.1
MVEEQLKPSTGTLAWSSVLTEKRSNGHHGSSGYQKHFSFVYPRRSYYVQRSARSVVLKWMEPHRTIASGGKVRESCRPESSRGLPSDHVPPKKPVQRHAIQLGPGGIHFLPAQGGKKHGKVSEPVLLYLPPSPPSHTNLVSLLGPNPLSFLHLLVRYPGLVLA